MFMLRGSTLACALSAFRLACGCGGAFHRTPLGTVLWDEPDRRPLSPRRSVRYVSYRFDAADDAVLRPLASVWTFPVAHEATNVNALDEVPSSSRFENRIGRFAMAQREVACDACDAIEPDAPFPWAVVGGKTYGSNPGFTIEHARAVRCWVKTDGRLQPERATAADAIAAVVFHAPGYFVPCNRVMFVRRDPLRIAPNAELLGGARIPLGDREIDAVLRAATQLPDGREPARSMELRTRALPGGRVCVALPAGLRYVALDVVASSEGRERTLPARLHVYRAGGRYEVAALERLDREEAP